MMRHTLQRAVITALILVASAGVPAVAWSQNAAPRASGLKIVVIAGEDAVNIIQQKTAVAPIIEVRDRNDQPVAGAIVSFAIRGGRATFGGARTLSVTTDGAGRAAAQGLTPLSNGTYQIAVTATFEGQTATATISQTNVATAAAAQAIGAGVAVGVTAGAAAASGGGLSSIAIGAIAAAAGGGALVAVKAASAGSSNPSGSTNPTNPTGPASPTSPTSPISTTYSGPLSGQLSETAMTTSAGGTTTCVSTRAITGTLTITLEQLADGTVTGRASTTGTETEIAFTTSQFCQAAISLGGFNTGGPVTGTTGNFGYSFTSSGTGSTATTSFSGALSNGVISGTMTLTRTRAGPGLAPGSTVTASGSSSFPVTLR